MKKFLSVLLMVAGLMSCGDDDKPFIPELNKLTSVTCTKNGNAFFNANITYDQDKQINRIILNTEGNQFTDNYIIVDPAMADNGKMYTGFTTDFAITMSKLCSKADIILPNISEACFMLNREYVGENASLETIKELLLELIKLGSKYAVITGVTLPKGELGFIGYDSSNKDFFMYGTKEVPIKSHGTGDVFASTFTGALMNDYSVFDALKIAADFTYLCIEDTYKDPNAVDYAVNFETQIPNLLKLLNR